MRISVRVKPNAKLEKAEKISEREFILWTRQPAVEGKANAAVIELLSEYFRAPKSRITIFKGQRNKNKIIEIDVLNLR